MLQYLRDELGHKLCEAFSRDAAIGRPVRQLANMFASCLGLESRHRAAQMSASSTQACKQTLLCFRLQRIFGISTCYHEHLRLLGPRLQEAAAQ